MDTLRTPGPSFTRFASAAGRCLLAFSLVAWCAWAQITTGSLSGTVTDPAGAVVVSAAVKVTNQATGVSVSLVTNEAGVFKAAFLIPGTYTVVIQAAGFRTFESTGIVVELAHEPVVNATLEIGAVGETVQVEGSAPLLVTDTSQLSTDVASERVVTLPGIQGAMDKMALTSPGVVMGFGNINSNGLVFSANG